MAKREKKKLIEMVVTVSVPHWLTAAQARREVRTLIGEQAFYGHISPTGAMDEIDESNLKVRSVEACPRNARRYG